MSGDSRRGAPDLERELAALREENARLKKLLRLTERESAKADGTQTAWFERAPGPVSMTSSPADKVAFYATLFGTRPDAYALFWENQRRGTSGWMPAVVGGWRRGRSRDEILFLPLTTDVIARHLTGEHHIGLYPMLPNDQTWWIAADFDGPDAMLDALAYLKAGRAAGVPTALEISRSGVGAHVWTFFTAPVPAAVARQLATGLIREAIALRGRMDLKAYDRLFPSQDSVPAGRFGNLIAAPLHGRSRKEFGTTVFLDLATLEPHDDQWEYLSSLDRLSPKDTARIARRLRDPVVGMHVETLHRPQSSRVRPTGAPQVPITLSGGVSMPIAALSPSAYGTLRHAASLSNPEFYERQRRRQSTWNIPRFVQSFDETLDGDLVLPRGLADTAQHIIEETGSACTVTDQRVQGAAITVSFTATLTDRQRAAVSALQSHDLGVLVAPPGSGKTVMACALVAAHGVATLVLVDRKTLAEQWRNQIRNWLGVKPGQLGGGRRKLTGVIDIVTLQTLARRDDLDDVLSQYGVVIADECHHVPAAAFDIAVRSIPARRWIGLTATPYRRDKLDDLIAFQLGPVRHVFSAPRADTIEGAAANQPEPILHLHPTTFTFTEALDLSVPGAIAAVHRALAENEARNHQIVTDVMAALDRGRHCLVLAQRTAHVDALAAAISSEGHTPVVLKGGLTVSARREALARLSEPDTSRRHLVIATGSFVGEGFDAPILDTLFLAGPLSFKGRLVQYVGRILRAHPGKQTAEVHDYHDVDVPVLAAALAKRAPGYVSLGFSDPRRL